MEFTGVELAGGAELAAPVKKDATSPVEKAVAGPCALEGRGMREARVEREEDRLLCSGVVEMPAGGAEGWWRGRRGGECGH